jgi:dTDP-4-dehydrorhamnose 3,5-epimerase
MPFTAAPIDGLWIFEPRLLEDERGYFFESYNHRQFTEAIGFEGVFVQDNQSLSKYGVMRGLHCQRPPFAQAKLIRVTRGEVWDVAVDLRKDSATYGQYFGLILSAENKRQFFIPRGFAHGFVVLSAEADLLYKCDNYYAPQCETGIIFDDRDLNIDWQIPDKDLMVSQKDLALKTLRASEIIF